MLDDSQFAEAVFDEVNELDSGEGTAERYSRDALRAWLLADRELALQLYTKAIALDPYDGLSFLNKGNLQIEMGDFEAGISDLETARDIDSELPWQNALIFRTLGPEAREKVRQRMLAQKDENQ